MAHSDINTSSCSGPKLRSADSQDTALYPPRKQPQRLLEPCLAYPRSDYSAIHRPLYVNLSAKSLLYFLHKGTTCFGMKRLKGDTVGRVWPLRMGTSKHHILEQLRHMIAETQSIPQPKGCRSGKCTRRDSVKVPAARDSGSTGRFGPSQSQVLSTPEAASPEQRSGSLS